MKKHFLEQIIDKKNHKEEFAIITNLSNDVKSPKTITDVIAPGPARSGTPRGLEEILINSSAETRLFSTAWLFLACRLPFTISIEIRKSMAPPAMLKVADEILRCDKIKSPKKPKNTSTKKAIAQPRRATLCFSL